MASTDTVTVACRLPNGLHLDLPGGARVTLKGCAIARGPEARMPVHLDDTGYALTHGVPAEHWEAWLERNSKLEIVERKLVFAAPRVDSVRAEARENEKRESGLDPIDPDRPGKGLERVSAMG